MNQQTSGVILFMGVTPFVRQKEHPAITWRKKVDKDALIGYSPVITSKEEPNERRQLQVSS